MEDTNEKKPAPELPEGLAGILNNPELLAMLPRVMAAVRPILAAQEKTGDDPLPAETREGQESALPEKREAERDRERLLLALKPFLNPERREAIDAILRMERLGGVLRNFR